MNALRLGCEGCGATVDVAPGLRTVTCAFCASPAVVIRPPQAGLPEPVFTAPFVKQRAEVLELVGAWLRKRTVFARSGVRHAKVEDVKAVYVPAYLYSAVARSTYSAQIGEKYVERRGKKTVTKFEWHALYGRHDAYVSDVLVTASRGLTNEELEALEPFDARQLRRYHAGLVAGFLAEEASRDPREGLHLAREETSAEVGRRIASFLPGDQRREVRHETQMQRESLDLVLLPVWILAARFDPKLPPFKLLVNGQTGEVTGKVPLSIVKIAAAVIAAVLLILLVAAVSRG